MPSEDIIVGLLTFSVIVVVLVKLWFDHLEYMNKQKSIKLDDLSLDLSIKYGKLEDDIAVLRYEVLDQIEDIQNKLEADKVIEYDDITQFVDGITSVQVKPSRYVELLSYEAELFELKLKLKEATENVEN